MKGDTQGAILQRDGKTYAVATRIPAGIVAPGELEKIAAVCSHVPAQAPRDFQEALQYYWFCHLAVITELNGWDSFNPGHLDQHLEPFFEADLGTPAEHFKSLLSRQVLFVDFAFDLV